MIVKLQLCNRSYIIIIKVIDIIDYACKRRILIKDWLEISQLNHICLLSFFFSFFLFICYRHYHALSPSIRYKRILNAWPIQVFYWEIVSCSCILMYGRKVVGISETANKTKCSLLKRNRKYNKPKERKYLSGIGNK